MGKYKNTKKITNNKNLIRIFLISSILLIVLFCTQVSYFALRYTKTYNGIYISDSFNVSNLSKYEIKDLLSTALTKNIDNLKVTLKRDNNYKDVYYKDINVKYDFDKAIDEAFSIGRKGNVFKRLFEITKLKFTKQYVELHFNIDNVKLKDMIEQFSKDASTSAYDPNIIVKGDKVYIREGQRGEVINKNLTYEMIMDYIQNGKSNILQVPLETKIPQKINIDEFYNRVCQKVQDAKFVVENNTVKIVPQVPGRTIDKATFEKIVKSLKSQPNHEALLPVSYIEPKVTANYLSENLYRDILATYSTSFTTNSVNNYNRSVNIRLGVGKINGHVIGPGETFSFNSVVGPRTANLGYKAAISYVGGKMVDAYGGGICQVSTTLYNVVVLADLQVVQRNNHYFTVGYVPLGMDASVSYGGSDLKFKNSTNWPIKVECWVTKDNKLYFSLKGTNMDPEKKVSFRQETLKTIQPQVRYIDDSSLETGKTIVVQSGKDGYVVNVYKIVSRNGVFQKEAFVSKNTYNPYTREIRRGTKKTETPVPAQTPEANSVDSGNNIPNPTPEEIISD